MGRLGKMVLQLEDGTEINLGNILKEGVGNKIKDSDVMVPVDVQSRYQKTVQFHSAVNVLPGTWNQTPGWVDVSGFESVGITLLNDASVITNLNVIWSNDGINQSGEENSVVPGTAVSRKAGLVTTKAKWMKLAVNNADSVAHVINTWLYLKS
jgi:hypothetical protein